MFGFQKQIVGVGEIDYGESRESQNVEKGFFSFSYFSSNRVGVERQDRGGGNGEEEKYLVVGILNNKK